MFASGLCCKNTPEFDDLFGFSVEDVEEEVIRGRKLVTFADIFQIQTDSVSYVLENTECYVYFLEVCHKCRKRGATAGCEVRRCKKSYHYPCAIQDGAVMVEDADKGMFGFVRERR